eukprot:197299-Chlamydomonas_euryale.AAC.1
MQHFAPKAGAGIHCSSSQNVVPFQQPSWRPTADHAHNRRCSQPSESPMPKVRLAGTHVRHADTQAGVPFCLRSVIHAAMAKKLLPGGTECGSPGATFPRVRLGMGGRLSPPLGTRAPASTHPAFPLSHLARGESGNRAMQARRGAEGAHGGRCRGRGGDRGSATALSCRSAPIVSLGVSLAASLSLGATTQSPRGALADAQPHRAPCRGARGVGGLSLDLEGRWQLRQRQCAATLYMETSTIQVCTSAKQHGSMHEASTSAAPVAAAGSRHRIRRALPPRGSAAAPLAAMQGCQPSVATYGAGASKESSTAGSGGSGGGTGPGAAALDADALGALQRLRSKRVSSDACPCSTCNGSGIVPCKACGGTGRLGRGGYNKKNPVNMSRIIGGRPMLPSGVGMAMHAGMHVHLRMRVHGAACRQACTCTKEIEQHPERHARACAWGSIPLGMRMRRAACRLACACACVGQHTTPHALVYARVACRVASAGQRACMCLEQHAH